MTYDAIVIGVGGMGSATLFHLARAGCKVLGIEQFGIPHDRGSSHGSTRIIRMAYSEGSEYVDLVRSAYEYWRELEALSGESILHITGGLDIGPEGSWTIEGSRKSCLEHDLAFEELDASEVNRRFPGYRLPESLRAIHQPDGGYVLCELAVKTYAEAARAHGAEVRPNEPVVAWQRDGEGVRVETSAGVYSSARLVLTAGPWAGKLAPALLPVCKPERQVLLWTDPLEAAPFDPARFPVFNMEAPEGRYYGFPNHRGEGFKIGRYHHLEQAADPDRVDRGCHPEDEAILRKGIAAYFPLANGPARRMTTCLFTNSPDEHFILDRYPGESNVTVAAGFSGHGFKFCSVIGKVMADLCLEGRTRWNIEPFRLGRPRLCA
jgi:sarcosine oxidase